MTIQSTPEEIAALVLSLLGRQAEDIPYGDLPYIDLPPDIAEKVNYALKRFSIESEVTI